MPAQAQRGNHREKYLPAPSEPMQQHKWRSMGRAFGIVQAHFAGIEGALDEAWMVFAHDILARNINTFLVERRAPRPSTCGRSLSTARARASPARGAGVVSQFATDPGFEHLDVSALDGIDGQHVVTQQYHVGELPRRDRA